VWSQYLKTEQLSFLLLARCDTLPTPNELKHYCESVQHVLLSQPATNHILTDCTMAHDQGRYSCTVPGAITQLGFSMAYKRMWYLIIDNVMIFLATWLNRPGSQRSLYLAGNV